MIMRDTIVDLIMTTNLFMAKKGQDIKIRRDLINAINAFTGEDSLDNIYVNNSDKFNIPDVTILHLYNKNFNMHLMNPENSNTCPFGYTIEIHERCFTELSAEELVSVIIHDLMQNVMSATAKVRFMKAYEHAISNYRPADILDIFDDLSHSEVVYIMFTSICTRPFRVPVMTDDYVGTDEVLKSVGLGDAYESYLAKRLPMSNDSVDSRIEREVRDDYRDVTTVIDACLDKTIQRYYDLIRNSIPLVSLQHVLSSGSSASLGFISKQRSYATRQGTSMAQADIMTESFNNPKNEIEIRFQLDKIISEMRYANTEAERNVILFKIKNMRIKLMKTRVGLDKQLEKSPANQSLRERLEYIMNIEDELDMLRDKTVKMEIKNRQFGIFLKYPQGYEG